MSTKTAREISPRIDEEDPTSADIRHAMLQRMEQRSWMVSAEDRTPQR